MEVYRVLIRFSVIASIFIVITSDILLWYNTPNAYFQGNFKGIFYNSNYLGLVTGVFIIPIIFLKFKIRPFLTGLIIINLLFILWETRSRSAILALLLICSIYLFLKLKFSKDKVKYFFMFFMLIFSVLFQNEKIVNISNNFIDKYEYNDNAFSTRIEIWDARIIGIIEKPIMGWGFGINPVLYSSKIKKIIKGVNDKKNNTEKGNSFLALLEESGIPLGLLQFSLLVFIFKTLLKNIIVKSETLIFYLISLVCFFHVNFESWLFYLGNFASLLFWLIILILFVDSSLENHTSVPKASIYKKNLININ